MYMYLPYYSVSRFANLTTKNLPIVYIVWESILMHQELHWPLSRPLDNGRKGFPSSRSLCSWAHINVLRPPKKILDPSLINEWMTDTFEALGSAVLRMVVMLKSIQSYPAVTIISRDRATRLESESLAPPLTPYRIGGTHVRSPLAQPSYLGRYTCIPPILGISIHWLLQKK